MRTIAVTGGIGSGKSVVCRVLSVMGFTVYDCDSRAKTIMDTDARMKKRIAEEITPYALCADGSLDRKAIADVVFSDPQKLAALNAIVHGAVRADIRRSMDDASRKGEKYFFVETAILYESGLDRMVDEVWVVTAPEAVRIQRAMSRDGADYDRIKARVEAQAAAPKGAHPCVNVIVNDGVSPVLPRIQSLLARRCEVVSEGRM